MAGLFGSAREGRPRTELERASLGSVRGLEVRLGRASRSVTDAARPETGLGGVGLGLLLCRRARAGVESADSGTS